MLPYFLRTVQFSFSLLCMALLFLLRKKWILVSVWSRSVNNIIWGIWSDQLSCGANNNSNPYLVYRRFKGSDDIFDTKLGWCFKFFTLCDQVVIANSRERVYFEQHILASLLVYQSYNLLRIKYAHISRHGRLCISWSSLKACNINPTMSWQNQPCIRQKNNRGYHWLQCNYL